MKKLENASGCREKRESLSLRAKAEKYKNNKIVKKEIGITLVALIVTTIFSYDENVKSSNNKGFLLQTI